MRKWRCVAGLVQPHRVRRIESQKHRLGRAGRVALRRPVCLSLRYLRIHRLPHRYLARLTRWYAPGGIPALRYHICQREHVREHCHLDLLIPRAGWGGAVLFDGERGGAVHLDQPHLGMIGRGRLDGFRVTVQLRAVALVLA
jgi:hypothetical protein